MNKIMLWTSALILSFAFSQAIFADDQSHNSCQQSACTCDHELVDKLDLSPDQQAKIKSIRDEARLVRIAHQKERLSLHNQIEELSKADQLDEAKLEILLNRKKEITKSAIKNRMLVKQKIYNVLNAQQKAKYDEMKQEWEDNHLATLHNLQNSLAP